MSIPFRESWSVIVGKEHTTESREVWAERVVATMRALRARAGVVRWEHDWPPREVQEDAATLEALIEANVSVNDVGERMEEMPKGFSMAGAGSSNTRLRLWLSVDSHAPEMHNSCTVDLEVRDLLPDAARRILEDGGRIWTPYWAAVYSTANMRVRRPELLEQGVPIQETNVRVLHWATFLSSSLMPAERIARLQGDPAVEVVPLDGGNEIVLGDAWRSPEALLAARTYEPLLSE